MLELLLRSLNILGIAHVKCVGPVSSAVSGLLSGQLVFGSFAEKTLCNRNHAVVRDNLVKTEQVTQNTYREFSLGTPIASSEVFCAMLVGNTGMTGG